MTHGQTVIGMKIGMVLVLLLGMVSPATAQVCVLPPSGLIGWWSGDVDGSDISSNGNDAMLQNGASAGVAGQVDKAFSFDGQDDIANTLLVLGTQGTIDLWVNPAAIAGGVNGLIGTFGKENGDDRLWINFRGPSGGLGVGSNRLVVNLGDCCVNEFDVPSPFSVGSWTHLALTFDYDTDDYRLYVAGQEVASSSASRDAPTQPFLFGGNDSDFGQSFFFNGLIDEVEVFNLGQHIGFQIIVDTRRQGTKLAILAECQLDGIVVVITIATSTSGTDTVTIEVVVLAV